MHMKTGQTVQVISGSDKGKKGKIIQVFPAQGRVVVDGVNKMYKHMKRRPAGQTAQRGKINQKGERMEFFGPINMSNVKVVEDVAAPAKAEPKKAAKKAAKAA